MIRNYIILLLIFGSVQMYGTETDTLIIKGRVIDTDSLPIPGVSVVIKGTTIGSYTNLDGYYSIVGYFNNEVVEEKILVFYYIGMQTKEEPINNRVEINALLEEGKVLEDVVVTALGKGGGKRTRWKDFEIPEFELPPPTPSARHILDRKFFNCNNLGCIDEILSDALEFNGYDEIAYFSVINGFAAVTRLEKIDKEGYSKAVPERWDTTINQGNFSFWEYFDSLLFGTKGQYRAIVFIITDKEFGKGNRKPQKKEVLAWFDKGYYLLPDEIAEMEFSQKHKVFALIYEFKQSENDVSAELSNPSTLTGKMHITRSNILTWLEQNQMNY